MTNGFGSIVLTLNNGLDEREDHVLRLEGAAYKTRHRTGTVTIHNGQVCGKYMAAV